MQRSSLWLERILRSGIAGQPWTATELQQISDHSLEDEGRSRAFGLTPQTVASILQDRLQLLQQVYPAARSLYPTEPLLPLWTTWLPLAQQIIQSRQAQSGPLIQGVLGLQGTGKTTVTRLLKGVLEQLGYPTVCFSLDDFYLTYQERQELRGRDPRLIWRGPPGTHDIELGWQILTQLRSPQQSRRGSPISIPRFDKSAWGGAGDRTHPESVSACEIVLFEGWFVGYRPLEPQRFDQAPAPILTPEDQTFARDCNQRLAAYLPLWGLLDRLLVLQPVDYHLSYQWRQQAEHQLIAQQKSGMTDNEIAQFVGYFWKALHPKLFLPELLSHPEWVDLVIAIEADHSPGPVNCPKG